MSPGNRIELSSIAWLPFTAGWYGLQSLHEHEIASKTEKSGGDCILNAEDIERYIDISLTQGICLTLPNPNNMPEIPSTLQCSQCGKPYVIHIPYEYCQEGPRDLCDDCILKKKRESMKKVTCKKCGHSWFTESKRYSVACSRCKSQVVTGFNPGVKI